MMNEIRKNIIIHLANGQFVSGEQLGVMFGISRAAISKHIEALTEMGLDIYRVTGKGYQLSEPLDLLQVEKIISYFDKNDDVPNITVLDVIDSTNSYLLRKVPHQIIDGQLCVAEYQSAGRGRRGRQWISPYGSNIYLSLYRYLDQGMSAAMGLNVVVALGVFDAIKKLYQHDVELKWPNDIYLHGKKLAGILIDLEGQPMEACHCVIGIGLNLSMPEASAKQVDQPWSDLSTVVGHHISRNELTAELIKQINSRLIEHNKNGLRNMLDDWHQHDLYFNKAIKIITGDKETHGISRGIDAQGALLMESSGVVSPVYGGEVSLRGLE